MRPALMQAAAVEERNNREDEMEAWACVLAMRWLFEATTRDALPW